MEKPHFISSVGLLENIQSILGFSHSFEIRVNFGVLVGGIFGLVCLESVLTQNYNRPNGIRIARELARLRYIFSPAGELPEWPMGTDCKSVGDAFVGSNPTLPTISIAPS